MDISSWSALSPRSSLGAGIAGSWATATNAWPRATAPARANHPPTPPPDASSVGGRRHRIELGALDQLVASIERDGLLHPPTVTPDGVLVCGARRLAAIKQLGWRTVNVWVRAGITDRLGQLLAEQDDNVLHKPLTPTEQTALYRELKAVIDRKSVV